MGIEGRKASVEGYGCSLNKADTQAIISLLEEKGIGMANPEKLSRGDFAIINACAVKQTTEHRMLSRIEALSKLSKRKGFRLVVFGCISKISPERVQKISEKIVILPPALEELSKFLGSGEKKFTPEFISKAGEGTVSIIPACRGCLGSCSYCTVRHARGALKSHSIEEIRKAFSKGLKAGKKEFWLTAQDLGCYGFDIGESLAKLLKELLKEKGECRIRLGMMNVQHLRKFLPELLEQMKDERVFKFLHLPLQSGNNRVLGLMSRKYTVEEWLGTVRECRRKFPEITIATDIIAGFPTETENEFNDTLKALESAECDVVNISRYGKRPFTKAALMKEVSSIEKKQRSRKATELYDRLARRANEKMLGKELAVLIDENGKGKTVMGRSGNYKPVVLKQGKPGEFVKARVVKAGKSFLSAERQTVK